MKNIKNKQEISKILQMPLFLLIMPVLEKINFTNKMRWNYDPNKQLVVLESYPYQFRWHLKWETNAKFLHTKFPQYPIAFKTEPITLKNFIRFNRNGIEVNYKSLKTTNIAPIYNDDNRTEILDTVVLSEEKPKVNLSKITRCQVMKKGLTIGNGKILTFPLDDEESSIDNIVSINLTTAKLLVPFLEACNKFHIMHESIRIWDFEPYFEILILDKNLILDDKIVNKKTPVKKGIFNIAEIRKQADTFVKLKKQPKIEISTRRNDYAINIRLNDKIIKSTKVKFIDDAKLEKEKQEEEIESDIQNFIQSCKNPLEKIEYKEQFPKFSVNKKTLCKALEILNAISKEEKNLFFIAQKNEIKIMSYKGLNWIITKIPAKIITNGVFCLSSKIIPIFKNSKNNLINFNFKNNLLEFQNSSLKLIDEPPFEIINNEITESVFVRKDRFFDIINTFKSISDYSIIRFQVSENKLSAFIVSSCFAKISMPIINGFNKSFSISSESMKILESIEKDSSEILQLHLVKDNDVILVKTNKSVLSINLENGNAIGTATSCELLKDYKLNRKELAKFSFPLPPIEVQDKFALMVEKIETIKEQENQKLAYLET